MFTRTWRASEACTLRIIFLRLVLPLFWNLRIFSLLRWRFSFFALTRDASSSVLVVRLGRPRKDGAGANACWKMFGFGVLVLVDRWERVVSLSDQVYQRKLDRVEDPWSSFYGTPLEIRNIIQKTNRNVKHKYKRWKKKTFNRWTEYFKDDFHSDKGGTRARDSHFTNP